MIVISFMNTKIEFGETNEVDDKKCLEFSDLQNGDFFTFRSPIGYWHSRLYLMVDKNSIENQCIGFDLDNGGVYTTHFSETDNVVYKIFKTVKVLNGVEFKNNL